MKKQTKTSAEQQLAGRGPLEDELALLRAQVRRLAAQIELNEDSDEELKMLRVLTEMIRAIGELERFRLQASAADALPGAGLPQLMASLRPSDPL